ncbi:hypothetical protein M9H77_25895 [Catharanthus roseus]|uniref:Uncharacterized protein n=1 Tax=Catharanthus roseus TaxID=4058 RepID=A0ACC0A858_CATRO|nr:hypothetical protein M9H77_25895 [Catharanthus roseus]
MVSDITRVYVDNLARRDIRTYGYQLAGIDRRMIEVDDMTIGVLEGPLSSQLSMLVLREMYKPSFVDASYISPPPSVGDTSYAPPSQSVLGLSFDAPPPLSTAGSSVPHMPISAASSSDSEEHGD